MLSFDAGAVLKATGTLRSLESQIHNFLDKDTIKKTDIVRRGDARQFRTRLDTLSEAISGLNARATGLAVAELRALVAKRKLDVTYKLTADLIEDIAVTLRRELSLIKTFCIEPSKDIFYSMNLASFGDNFQTDFPSAVYEIDEAGKCHALSRSTACVFHLMRSMEIGIGAIARSLAIPDPVKESERNWGKILGKIKAEIDRRSGAKPAAWNGSDKMFFEDAYVSLDAVRVSWRNATMHVDNKYLDDEAEHIFVAVRGFMKKLAARMDEVGEPLA